MSCLISLQKIEVDRVPRIINDWSSYYSIFLCRDSASGGRRQFSSLASSGAMAHPVAVCLAHRRNHCLLPWHGREEQLAGIHDASLLRDCQTDRFVSKYFSG